MAEFASKGVAGSGLGLGIAGTALGLLNGNGNGLGGILGGNGGMLQVLISEQAGQIARLDAEKYADNVGIAAFKEALAAMDKRYDENRRRIDVLEQRMAESAVREAELRGDIKNLFTYLNGNFVPGKLVMPADAICPETMPRYNSWTAPTNTPAAAAAMSSK